MTDERIPTWGEGAERLLAKLPALLSEGSISINDARVIQYLAGLLATPERIVQVQLGSGNPGWRPPSWVGH